MRLLSIIVCIVILLNLVTSDRGFDIVKSSSSHLYDDSMELTSSNEKRSLETQFDSSKNTKTTDDDFSLGEEKETSPKESEMSLEASEEDPFNKATQQPNEREKNNDVLTTNPLDVTLPSSTTKINSLDMIEKITTADMDLFNDETTIKMVNEGLAFMMKTIPTNINNNQEDLITTSSPKEIMNDRNLESDDKSDMFLDISNEDGKEKISSKTTRDDVQFDIGDEDSNEDQNSKIVVKNDDQAMNSSSVVDIKAAEDITIPFNAADTLLTTEDPIEAKNTKIHNILLNEEINGTESESNSMEVKQSTIFVGPSITTTHLPILNKEEDNSEVFVIDDDKGIFSHVPTTISPHIEEKSSETIAHLSTSLTVSSAEETSTKFPDSSEFTELTSTVIIPKILSTTLEPTEESIDDKVLTTLIQEVDFSKTTEPSIIIDVSSSKDDITTSNKIDAEIMTTINELLTTQFPEGENMTFDEKVIQSKENVEGDIKKANNKSDEGDDGIILNHEGVDLSTTTTTNSTSTTTTSSTTTTTTTPPTTISTTVSLNETSPTTITPENIAIEIMKNLQSETANKTNEDNLTFAGFLFSTPISDYIIPIIIISSIIFIIFIILLIYITCKKRKENGMLRFTNSQTSSTLSKIEEGVNMDHVNDYRYHDNSRVSVSSIPKDKDVNLVGFGPVDAVSKNEIEKRR
uniref:SEA domain-containing protein n=1 Tax=Strongyloides papillosus TaxID=174720 RepID=A0A0N5B304_STREA